MHRVLAAAVLVTACGEAPRSGREYALVATLEVIKPIDIAAMTDDFQDARLVSQTDRTATVEVRSYPLAEPPPIGADPDWRRHDLVDVRLWPYLLPGPTSNWDDAMRGELITALRAAGIDPDRLDDRELVKRTSAWLFESGTFRHLDDFVAYDVAFTGGVPRIDPARRSHFDEQRAGCKLASDEQALALGVLGKQMFEARVHGDCTGSAILETTVLRALGIPTRIVETIPIVDGNDPAQRAMVAALRHDGVRATIERGLPHDVWANHTYVEVYIGGRWVRLNYARLGQPPLDHYYFGLMIHVATLRDWGESELGRTWGEYVGGEGPRLSSVNPYRALALRDEIAPGATIDLGTVDDTVIRGVVTGGEPGVPQQIRDDLASSHCFVLVTPDVDDRFKTQPIEVTLSANGQPDVVARVKGSITGFRPDIDGYYTCPAQPLVAGAVYRIIPHERDWEVGRDVTYTAR